MQSTPSNQNRFRRWRRTMLAYAGMAVLLGGAAAVFWWNASQSLIACIELEVRAGVPIGMARADAEAWAQQRFGFVPTYHDDPWGDRFAGKSVPELAGIPPDSLAGLVRTTARRPGMVGTALNTLRPEHVWVYFLIDRENRVCGYWFLSLSQLRVMEQERRRAQGVPR
jgi:hypothetical protein